MKFGLCKGGADMRRGRGGGGCMSMHSMQGIIYSFGSMHCGVRHTLKGAANHSSKVSEELKTRGRTKLRRDHSSPRLFWMGVPVSSTRCLKR